MLTLKKMATNRENPTFSRLFVLKEFYVCVCVSLRQIARNFLGMQWRKLTRSLCQTFGRLTFLDSTTDVLRPEHQHRHSCHLDPHCRESFSAPGNPPRVTSCFQIPGTMASMKSLDATLGKFGSAIHAPTIQNSYKFTLHPGKAGALKSLKHCWLFKLVAGLQDHTECSLTGVFPNT